MLVFVWYALLFVHSSFAIILKRKRELVALLLLSIRCHVTFNVLWFFFLMVPWVGLQCFIVVFPDHTYFPFAICKTFLNQTGHVAEILEFRKTEALCNVVIKRQYV